MIAALTRLTERLLATRFGRLVVAYAESGAPNYAAGVAFNAFFTMFPLILGLLAILGIIVRSNEIEAEVRTTIVSVFPIADHESLVAALQGVKENAGWFAAVSIGGLLWSGTSLFCSLEFALDEIYGCRGRDPIRQRLMGLQMLGIFVVAIVVAIVANSAIAFIPDIPHLGVLMGAAVLIALMLAIYRIVPNRKVSFSEEWRGAVLAGISIELVTLLFPLYSQITRSFSSYGQGFALMFLLATWLYLLSQLLLVGAVFNRMLTGGVPELEHLAAIAGAKDSLRRRMEA
ncbi:MAG: YihY/virulence factor BrkB family protein [Candidatus Limnocylindria bacterium]